MMRVRGGFLFIFSIVLLLLSGSVLAVPPHRWFAEAEVDLSSINGLLSNGLSVCDEAVNRSLLVNCSLDFNTSLQLQYDVDALDASLASIEELEDLLFFSIDDIGSVAAIAGSYSVLEDLIIPLQWMARNLSSFVEQHAEIVTGFIALVNRSFVDGNGSSAQELLADVRAGIVQGRQQIRDTREILNSAPWDVSVSELEGKLVVFEGVMDQYDGYIDQLAGYFPQSEPLITIFAEEAVVYLSEELVLYGYCMEGNQFIANQTVLIYQNDSLVGEVMADVDGRYELIITVDRNVISGWYQYYAAMHVQGIWYYSDVVDIKISRIPTYIEFMVSPFHVYINGSLRVQGQVSDHQKNGLHSEGVFIFGDKEFDFVTDNDGLFSFNYVIGVDFGKYNSRVLVPISRYYLGAVSDSIQISVDTPTRLSLTTTHFNMSMDEDVLFVGSLVSGIDGSPLRNKSILLFVGNSMVGSAQTNSLGDFQYVFSSNALGAGQYAFTAQYISDEVQWRGSASELIWLNFEMSVWAYMSLIILSVVIVGVFLCFWLFRNQFSQWFNQVQLKTRAESVSPIERPRLRFARRIGRSFRRIQRGARLTEDAIREAVFAQYRLLLRFLVAEGLMVRTTDSHIDLQQRMMHQGFPRDSVVLVTDTFEQAMYSQQPISYDQLLTFDQNVFILMTQGGMP